jgi:hypothetical protein
MMDMVVMEGKLVDGGSRVGGGGRWAVGCWKAVVVKEGVVGYRDGDR